MRSAGARVGGLGGGGGGVTVTAGRVPGAGFVSEGVAAGSAGFAPCGTVSAGVVIVSGCVAAGGVGTPLGACDQARPAKPSSIMAELLRSNSRLLRMHSEV